MRELLLGAVICSLCACVPAAYPRLEVELEVAGTDSVEPYRVYFDEVFVGETAERLLTVRNVGSAPASVDQLVISPDAFSLPNPAGRVLQPGDSYQLPVVFTPDNDGAATGTLRFVTNEPDEPVVTVLLDAIASPPALVFWPPTVEFGEVDVGCSQTVEVTLANTTDRSALVTALTQNPPNALDWSLQIPEGPPFEVLGGESVDLAVIWMPSSAGALAVDVTVQSNGAGAEGLTLTSTGVATPVLEWVETTTVGEESIDLVFVVDEPSDVQSPATTAAAAAGLFSTLDLWTPNWQVMVIPMDPLQAPLLVGGAFIDANTPDPVATLATTLESMIDTLTPRAFDTVHAALGGTSLPAEDTLVEVLQPNASLHLVFITNGQELSTSSVVSDPLDFLAWLDAAHAGREVVHSITGGLTGCSGGGQTATAGTDYMQATVLTDGVWGSICDPNLVATLDAIGFAAQPPQPAGVFHLGRAPDPTTIEVRVAPPGGELSLTAQWDWEPDDNAVVFSTAARPAAGDTVEIRYFQPPCL